MKDVDTPEQSPAILSLCTGAGLLDEGLERAIGHIHTVAYVEIEAFAVWNLVKKMEQGVLAPAPVWTNLKTFPSKEFHHKIHGIIGGYPCQPFSHAGQRKGTDDERHLWPHIRAIIDTVRPLWCFFENVPGHLSLGYDEVYRSLHDMGYTVEAGIFSAAEAGATHNRERLFILAVGDTTNIRSCQFSEITGTPATNKDRKECWMHESERASALPGNESFKKSKSAMGDTQSPKPQNGILARGGGNGIADAGETVAYATTKRIQGRITTGTTQTNGQAYESGQFPIGPGQRQHEWEAPRVESGLGCAANGYNFREDDYSEMQSYRKRQS